MAASRPEGVGACADCLFWLRKGDNPIVGQPVQGTCHRFPPSVSTVLVPQGQGLSLTNIAAPPMTAGEFGCGEFKTRLPLADHVS